MWSGASEWASTSAPARLLRAVASLPGRALGQSPDGRLDELRRMLELQEPIVKKRLRDAGAIHELQAELTAWLANNANGSDEVRALLTHELESAFAGDGPRRAAVSHDAPVVLAAIMLLTTLSRRVAARERNRSQAAFDTFSAVAWYTSAVAVVGELVGPRIDRVVAAITPDAQIFDLFGTGITLQSVAGTVANAACNLYLTTTFLNLSEKIDRSRTETRDRKAGALSRAYRTLLIDEDVGAFVDDALEPEAIGHLVGVLLYGERPLAVGVDMPTGLEPSAAGFAAVFGRWANAEFRAWLAVRYRVNVTPVRVGDARVAGVTRHVALPEGCPRKPTWGPSYTRAAGRCNFVDLAAWGDAFARWRQSDF